MGTSPEDLTQMFADWEGGDHEALRDYAAAKNPFREALALRRKHPSPEHPDIAYTLCNYAYMMFDQRKYQEAAQLPNEVRGLAMPEFLLSHSTVVDCPLFVGVDGAFQSGFVAPLADRRVFGA